MRANRFPYASLSGITAILAAAATLAVIAGGGFSESALRLGSLVAWRFAFFVFFAALIAPPLCNLVPLCNALVRQRHQLVWSFSAAFGVFLFSVLIPNLVLPSSQSREGLGMILFVIFTGALAAGMAYAATPDAAMRLGAKAQRAVLAIAVTFFWLDYTLTALARISGPHRPDMSSDMFYGLSLSLMLAVLLLRLVDRLLFKGKDA